MKANVISAAQWLFALGLFLAVLALALPGQQLLMAAVGGGLMGSTWRHAFCHKS